MIAEVGQRNQMRVDPLSNVSFDIAIGVERKPVFEDEGGNVGIQHPLILPKHCQFESGHNLWVFDAAMIEDEFFGFFHGLCFQADSDIFEEPIYIRK